MSVIYSHSTVHICLAVIQATKGAQCATSKCWIAEPVMYWECCTEQQDQVYACLFGKAMPDHPSAFDGAKVSQLNRNCVFRSAACSALARLPSPRSGRFDSCKRQLTTSTAITRRSLRRIHTVHSLCAWLYHRFLLGYHVYLCGIVLRPVVLCQLLTPVQVYCK